METIACITDRIPLAVKRRFGITISTGFLHLDGISINVSSITDIELDDMSVLISAGKSYIWLYYDEYATQVTIN
jgi:hypothetical protein